MRTNLTTHVIFSRLQWDEPDCAPIAREPRAVTLRDGAIDNCRGIAILAVIVVHVSGHFLHRLLPGSAQWAALDVTDVGGQFAVPTFLMVSAIVLGRKLYALPQSSRFAAISRRIPRVLGIYLAASALFLGLDALIDRGLPSFHAIVFMLIWGKASFHLYFIIVLLQMMLLLPLLTKIVRANWSIARVAAGGLLCQFIVYAFNRYVHAAPYPGSLATWYILPIVAGVWLGAHDILPRPGRRTVGRLRWLTLLAFAAYLPFAAACDAGFNVDSAIYQATNWAYASLAALLALVIAQRAATTPAAFPLTFLGRRSLVIYLLHPIAIQAFDHYLRRCPINSTLCLLLYAAGAIVLPLVASWTIGFVGRVLHLSSHPKRCPGVRFSSASQMSSRFTQK